ncbi:MAG: hypothetical protein QM757_08385 [Paludibaculum sp.]
MEEVECMGACSWAPAVRCQLRFPPLHDTGAI